MINMFSLQNQVWGINFYIFFPGEVVLPSKKTYQFHPHFCRISMRKCWAVGVEVQQRLQSTYVCERVEIITIIIMRMAKGLYPLSGVSMGGGWWWCSMSCWVVPTRGGPTTDVGADLLGQLWEGRDFSRPFLRRNTVLPWPAGSSPSHTTQCFCRQHSLGRWGVGFGGETGVWFALGCCWGRAMWCPVAGQGQQFSHPPALVLGEEEMEAELLGWPDLVLTGTSIKFPWLSRWRHCCEVFWGRHLQESRIWKGTQLLWSWVAGCFPKCSQPCGPWPQHPFSAVQAELQEKQLFGFFFPTLPMALSLMPVAAWQCLSWWRGGRVPREGGKMPHHFLCVKIPGSVFSTFPDTSILLSAALSQLYSLQWFSSPNKCRLFRELFF